MRFKDVDPLKIDIIKEVGNIGAGNAATSLSSILGRRVKMSVPEVKIIPLSMVPEILGPPEIPVIGGLVDMEDGLNGHLMLTLGLREAYFMASLMCGRDASTVRDVQISDFSELDMSALCEVTNILVGSYLSAISSMTGLIISPSVPSMCADMAGALLSLIAIGYGMEGDSALFFETRFTDAEDDLSCNFFLLPDNVSYEKLMISLGGCLIDE